MLKEGKAKSTDHLDKVNANEMAHSLVSVSLGLSKATLDFSSHWKGRFETRAEPRTPALR